MINEGATFRWKGYRSSELSKGSSKKVWAVCDICGKGRWVQYRKCHALCISCVQIGKIHTEEHKRKIANAGRGEKNPNYGKAMPERTKNRLRLAYTNLPDDVREERRQQHIEAAKNAPPIADETREKMRVSHTGEKNYFYGKQHSDETREKMSSSWNRSEERLKRMGKAQIGKKRTEESKRKQSESLKGKYCGEKNSMYGRVGEKSPMWKGGISFEPYCPKFNEAFKESIREKFNRTCFLCPTTEAENGRKLSVHHINYNKDCLCDDSDCEFVPLCAKCHSKTNHNRTYWENLIMDKLAAITEVPATA